MSQQKHITHAGVVEQVTPDKITVRIVVASQCAACHAKGFCGLSGTTEKRIEIPRRGHSVQPGDEVQVVLLAGRGLAAVWWAYTLPLLLLLSLLLVLHDRGLSEPYSALIALGAVAVYYSLLRLFRGTFKKKYCFGVEKR